MPTPREIFDREALATVQARIAELRQAQTCETAMQLPEAVGEDVVVAGKEVQLTIFRQTGVPGLEGKVLVTVQLARHSLGGIVAYRLERGLVFSAQDVVREATEAELRASGS